MKRYGLLLPLLLAACGAPENSNLKAIVGAKLIAAPGHAPIDYSVIVVQDGKFLAVGPEALTPVPKGAAITRGIGFTIEPAPSGNPIAPGEPANFVMKQGNEQRTLRDGQWVE